MITSRHALLLLKALDIFPGIFNEFRRIIIILHNSDNLPVTPQLSFLTCTENTNTKNSIHKLKITSIIFKLHIMASLGQKIFNTKHKQNRTF